MIYKFYKSVNGEINNVLRDNKDSIPFDPANTDYASFKKEVLSGEAKLQDAEGVEMSADAAQAFIKELP